MVQNAVTDHHVEEALLQGRIEEVHLREGCALDPLSFLEGLRQLKRIQADVHAKDGPVRDRQKIGELAGSAADLENASLVWNLVVKQSREVPSACLFEKRTLAIELVVVREGRLVVEGLDDLGHVLGVLAVLVWQDEQARNPVFNSVAGAADWIMSAFGTN